MKLSDSLDLSVLAFLEKGDMTLIADELDVDRCYVSKVCRGKHYNQKILVAAINKALERKGQFPKQVLKS